MSKFIKPIEQRDLDAIKKLIESGENINAHVTSILDYGLILYGLTPIMIAIYFKRVSIVKLLLELDADVEKSSIEVSTKITGTTQWAPAITPLEFAISHAPTDSMIEIIRLIVEKCKLKPEVLTKALTNAIARRSYLKVKLIVSIGCDVNALTTSTANIVLSQYPDPIEIWNRFVIRRQNDMLRLVIFNMFENTTMSCEDRHWISYNDFPECFKIFKVLIEAGAIVKKHHMAQLNHVAITREQYDKNNVLKVIQYLRDYNLKQSAIKLKVFDHTLPQEILYSVKSYLPTLFESS